jgi:hypothetical protein
MIAARAAGVSHHGFRWRRGWGCAQPMVSHGHFFDQPMGIEENRKGCPTLAAAAFQALKHGRLRARCGCCFGGEERSWELELGGIAPAARSRGTGNTQGRMPMVACARG